MKTSADLTPEEYAEPVFYCKDCHSLYILMDEHMADEDWDGSYCGICHSTEIGECSIGDWLKEEERRTNKRKEIEWSK